MGSRNTAVATDQGFPTLGLMDFKLDFSAPFHASLVPPDFKENLNTANSDVRAGNSAKSPSVTSVSRTLTRLPKRTTSIHDEENVSVKRGSYLGIESKPIKEYLKVISREFEFSRMDKVGPEIPKSATIKSSEKSTFSLSDGNSISASPTSTIHSTRIAEETTMLNEEPGISAISPQEADGSEPREGVISPTPVKSINSILTSSRSSKFESVSTESESLSPASSSLELGPIGAKDINAGVPPPVINYSELGENEVTLSRKLDAVKIERSRITPILSGSGSGLEINVIAASVPSLYAKNSSYAFDGRFLSPSYQHAAPSSPSGGGGGNPVSQWDTFSFTAKSPVGGHSSEPPPPSYDTSAYDPRLKSRISNQDARGIMSRSPSPNQNLKSESSPADLPFVSPTSMLSQGPLSEIPHPARTTSAAASEVLFGAAPRPVSMIENQGWTMHDKSPSVSGAKASPQPHQASELKLLPPFLLASATVRGIMTSEERKIGIEKISNAPSSSSNRNTDDEDSSRWSLNDNKNKESIPKCEPLPLFASSTAQNPYISSNSPSPFYIPARTYFPMSSVQGHGWYPLPMQSNQNMKVPISNYPGQRIADNPSNLMHWEAPMGATPQSTYHNVPGTSGPKFEGSPGQNQWRNSVPNFRQPTRFIGSGAPHSALFLQSTSMMAPQGVHPMLIGTPQSQHSRSPAPLWPPPLDDTGSQTPKIPNSIANIAEMKQSSLIPKFARRGSPIPTSFHAPTSPFARGVVAPGHPMRSSPLLSPLVTPLESPGMRTTSPMLR
jgi:hypothetical protein